jgi:hypothetical protein
VPLWVSPGGQFRVVGLDIALAVVGNGSQLAVVLEFVLELGELSDNPFALGDGGLVFGVVERAVHVVNALGEDDGPSRARRRVRKRSRVAGAVLL